MDTNDATDTDVKLRTFMEPYISSFQLAQTPLSHHTSGVPSTASSSRCFPRDLLLQPSELLPYQQLMRAVQASTPVDILPTSPYDDRLPVEPEMILPRACSNAAAPNDCSDSVLQPPSLSLFNDRSIASCVSPSAYDTSGYYSSVTSSFPDGVVGRDVRASQTPPLSDSVFGGCRKEDGVDDDVGGSDDRVECGDGVDAYYRQLERMYGAPPPRRYPVAYYNAKLALDQLMPPTVGSSTPPPPIFADRTSLDGSGTTLSSQQMSASFQRFLIGCSVGFPAFSSSSAAAAGMSSRQKTSPVAESGGGRAGPRRTRTCFTPSQLQHLRQIFDRTPYIDPKQRQVIAATCGISEQKVKVWFQNQRSKMKRLTKNAIANVAPSHSTNNCYSENFTNGTGIPPDSSVLPTADALDSTGASFADDAESHLSQKLFIQFQTYAQTSSPESSYSSSSNSSEGYNSLENSNKHCG